MFLYGKDPIVVIKNVFQFYYLENRGAALGLLQGRQTVFLIITIVVLAVIVFLYARLPFERKYRFLRILMVFIAAGALGNCIDRVARGYVIDFLYFYGIDFPVFNVADCYVTISVIVLILVLIFKYKDADYAEMGNSIRFKKKES